MSRPAPPTMALVQALRRVLALEAGDPSPPPPPRTDPQRDGPGALHEPGDLHAAVAFHGVASVLAPWAGDLGLDQSGEARLRAAGRLAAARALQQAAEVARLQVAFDEAGVRVLVAKGLPLALCTTGRLTGRGVGDVDLLVADADVERADRLLAGLGYASLAGPRSRPVDSPYADLFRRYRGSTSYQHGGGIVDLHWRLAGLGAGGDHLDDLWDRRRRFEVAGAEVAAPGDADTLLIVASHGTGHAFERLKWVVDVARLLDRLPAPVVATAERRADGAAGGRALRAAALVAAHVRPGTAAAVPGAALDRRARAVADEAWRVTLQAWPPEPLGLRVVTRRVRYYVSVPDHLAGRGRLARDLLVVSPLDWDEAPLPRRLAPLYVALRLPLLARRRRRARLRRAATAR